MSLPPWKWPMSWRILILLNISFYNLMGNVFAAGVPPLFDLLIQDFRCSIEEASRLTSYSLLMLGLANLWTLPCVEYVGKRYTILGSMSIFLGANIWSAYANSYNSLLASRFVGGASGGMVEALGPFIVSDCFPEHQLARAMVVYVGALAAGSAIGPIISGSIASGLNSWRWFFGISCIAIGINLITCILMLPETTYTEDVSIDQLPLDTDESKNSQSCIEQATGPRPESPASGEYSLRKLWIEKSFSRNLACAQPKSNPMKIFLEPIPLILNPKVFITTLVFGITIGWTVLTSVVISNVFAMPPLLWKPWQLGLLNFGPLIGILLGLPLGGILADMLSKHAASKANGEHQPRSRLPAIILGAVISPIGCLVIGFSLQNNYHWIAIAAGYGMLTFGLTASANVLLTYCVDCLRGQSGHVGVLINVVKNAIGFGVSFASMEWFFKVGPRNQFGTMTGVLWGAYLTIIPLYFFNRPTRKVLGGAV
ncbi:major facilitator superfamily domain-containing protein [Bisporella sp. PMI_857]|nr:major facilitator superfamily domain-containing protein [Bisporella sp. PMI_857]